MYEISFASHIFIWGVCGIKNSFECRHIFVVTVHFSVGSGIFRVELSKIFVGLPGTVLVHKKNNSLKRCFFISL